MNYLEEIKATSEANQAKLHRTKLNLKLNLIKNIQITKALKECTILIKSGEVKKASKILNKTK